MKWNKPFEKRRILKRSCTPSSSIHLKVFTLSLKVYCVGIWRDLRNWARLVKCDGRSQLQDLFFAWCSFPGLVPTSNNHQTPDYCSSRLHRSQQKHESAQTRWTFLSHMKMIGMILLPSCFAFLLAKCMCKEAWQGRGKVKKEEEAVVFCLKKKVSVNRKYCAAW